MHRYAIALGRAALLLVSAAGAEPRRAPPVALEYTRGAGAGGCPDIDALRGAVAKEMGYDPFASSSRAADRRLVVSIDRRGGDLVVEMELRDAAGQLVWDLKSMRSRGDCAALVGALGLSVAIRLDPEPAPVCPSPPSVPVDARVSAEEAAPPLPPAVRELPSRPYFLLGGGPVLAFESPAAAAPGVSIFAGVRWSIVSLEVEAHAVLPGAGDKQGHAIDAASFAASLAPCAHVGWFFGCGLVQAGFVHLSGPDAPPHFRALGVAGAGLRGGLEWHRSRRLAVRIHADLLGTLVPAEVVLRDRWIWSAPEVVGLLGVDLEALLFSGSPTVDGGVRSTPSTKEPTP